MDKHELGVDFAIELLKSAERRVELFEEEGRDAVFVEWAKAVRDRTREVLRRAVILHEANTSVGHTHFAMPHGWTHWEAP